MLAGWVYLKQGAWIRSEDRKCSSGSARQEAGVVKCDVVIAMLSDSPDDNASVAGR